MYHAFTWPATKYLVGLVHGIHWLMFNFQLGAVISQDNKPIVFKSRKLNLAQVNYTTFDREFLSIVESKKAQKYTAFFWDRGWFSTIPILVYCCVSFCFFLLLLSLVVFRMLLAGDNWFSSIITLLQNPTYKNYNELNTTYILINYEKTFHFRILSQNKY